MKKMIIYFYILMLCLSARDNIEFTGGQDGYFGLVSMSSSNSIIDIEYDNTYNDHNGVMVDDSNFAIIKFNFTATGGETIILTYDSSMTLTNGEDTISITDIEANTGDEFTMPSNGEQEIKLKGKMTISSSIGQSGEYSTNYTLDADYKDPE